MDLSLLRFLIAVAEEGTVTAAARRMHCVQSNVTARIHQLEQEVGVPLFQRVGRRLRLTPHGQTLLEYARRIQQLTEEARQATQAADRPVGTLRLGSMETAASLRLAPVLPRFHRQYPEVQLQLQTGTTRDLIGQVLDLELDAVLVAGPVEHPSLIAEHVIREELVLVTDASVKDVGQLKERANINLLLFKRGCNYRDRLIRWARDHAPQGFRESEFGSIEAILSCVAAGVGVSAMPKAVIDASPMASMLKTHRLPRELRESDTVLVRRKDAFLTGALSAFMEVLSGEVEVAA